MTPKQLQDRCRGSLVGGAVGDALGFEVEFMSLASILKRFGQKGISEYVLDKSGVAQFSDDTQMSLFTAEGLLSAIADGKLGEKDILPYIATAYEHWYYTQCNPPLKLSNSWLTHLSALWACRAPGLTCMSALQTITESNGAPVTNNSKGCGGVMRVAPIGIFSAAHPKDIDLEHAGYLAGYAADITHKHPLSTFSSMALAMIVADCIACDKVDRASFRFIVIDRVFKLLGLYFEEDKHLVELKSLIIQALVLAESEATDTDAIRELGEGWVADETLAIAIFSVMRYIDDFERCICCAVNHDGDCDSTGAVAGNIVGAILGYSAIPEKYLTNLELHDVILSVADDLAGVSPEEQRIERYHNHMPYGVEVGNLIMEFTPDFINKLKANEVFVFGSNLSGHHGGGAARAALYKFGAVWGQGVGLQGQSYGIPTMQGGVDTIKPYVDEFIEFAKAHPELKFYVTRIGCGIAGFKDAEIAPLFQDALSVNNIILPKSFADILEPR